MKFLFFREQLLIVASGALRRIQARRSLHRSQLRTAGPPGCRFEEMESRLALSVSAAINAPSVNTTMPQTAFVAAPPVPVAAAVQAPSSTSVAVQPPAFNAQASEIDQAFADAELFAPNATAFAAEIQPQITSPVDLVFALHEGETLPVQLDNLDGDLEITLHADLGSISEEPTSLILNSPDGKLTVSIDLDFTTDGANSAALGFAVLDEAPAPSFPNSDTSVLAGGGGAGISAPDAPTPPFTIPSGGGGDDGSSLTIFSITRVNSNSNSREDTALLEDPFESSGDDVSTDLDKREPTSELAEESSPSQYAKPTEQIIPAAVDFLPLPELPPTTRELKEAFGPERQLGIPETVPMLLQDARASPGQASSIQTPMVMSGCSLPFAVGLTFSLVGQKRCRRRAPPCNALAP